MKRPQFSIAVNSASLDVVGEPDCLCVEKRRCESNDKPISGGAIGGQ